MELKGLSLSKTSCLSYMLSFSLLSPSFVCNTILTESANPKGTNTHAHKLNFDFFPTNGKKRQDLQQRHELASATLTARHPRSEEVKSFYSTPSRWQRYCRSMERHKERNVTLRHETFAKSEKQTKTKTIYRVRISLNTLLWTSWSPAG